MNLITGALLGLFLGLLFAFLLEYLDSSIRNMDDVKNYLKINALGMVPFVELESSGESEEKKKEVITRNVISLREFWNTNDTSVPMFVLEAYKIIRTNLAFGGGENQSFRVFQVTSAVKGEGKTTTAANLGISMAEAGLRTLIIDADMRKPSVHRIFELGKREAGLSTVLNDQHSWQEAVVQTPVQNLFCIPVGPVPKNPAELLSSRRLKGIIEEFRDHYDIVLIDSPPVISVADAPLIASYVDGTILVVRAGFIPRHLCLQAKGVLESVSGKVIGCILNSVQSHHQPYYYYHPYYGKYYYSRYYGGDHEEEAGKTKKKKAKRHKKSHHRTDHQVASEFEKLNALREPILALLSSGVRRLAGLIKPESDKRNKYKLPDENP